TDDDFHPEQLFKNCGTVTHVDENKIGSAWIEFQFHHPELFLQINPTDIDDVFGLLQVWGVPERGQRRDLPNAVHIKWLPRLLQNLDHLRPRKCVSDAKASQSMNLRKRSKDDNVPAGSNITQRVRRILQELKVSFIQNRADPIGHAFDEGVHFFLVKQRSSWIVWVG